MTARMPRSGDGGQPGRVPDPRRQQRAEATRKADKISESGANTRGRGHASARDRRAEAKRDARNG